jgi:D-alanine transaminase
LVAETTSANIVLAVPRADGTTELVTPSLESVPILAGVTRDLLIDAGARYGLPISQRAVYLEELRSATEIMALGTLTMVTSVNKLDGRPVGTGTPGPIARKLMEAMLKAIRA